jgi:hypothetical protein
VDQKSGEDMTRAIEPPPSKEKPDVKEGILARALQIVFMFFIMALELFLGAGTGRTRMNSVKLR